MFKRLADVSTDYFEGTDEELEMPGQGAGSGGTFSTLPTSTTSVASMLKSLMQSGAKAVNTVARKAQSVVSPNLPPPAAPPSGMESETLLYIVLGAGVLYFVTKKKRRR